MNSFFKQISTSRFKDYLLAIFIITAISLICRSFANSQNYHVVSFILLFAVSVMSTFMGVGPVLLASTLSALAWNYFFIPPNHTFHIEKAEDILILGLFFIVAIVYGVQTTRLVKQEKLTSDKEKRTNALYQLTKELSKASGIDDVLKASRTEYVRNFKVEPLFILQDGENNLGSTGRLVKDRKLSDEEYEVAMWVFNHLEPAGAFTQHFTNIELTFYPLKGTILNPGVLALKQEVAFNMDMRSYNDTFVTQVSNAIEREFLGEMAQKVRFLNESDRLYKTLFNSISHEFRIPVATIMGASDTILNETNNPQTQNVLCQEIFTASLRLNRLIENLLNISRLESGHISVRLDWYDVNDLLNKVSRELVDELKPFKIERTIQDNMPPIKIDFGLMEQVLYNLVYNCTQYTPQGSTISIDVKHSNHYFTIEVSDEGPGISRENQKQIFQKFFRAKSDKTGGLGLGLSIVKGFVEAHNGMVAIENRQLKGATFRVTIPSEIPEITDIN